LSRLPEGKLEEKEEQVFQIIQENEGKGFNQLFNLCKHICARQTFKKIIDKFVEGKQLEKSQSSKQGFQYFVMDKFLEDEKEIEHYLKYKLNFVNVSFKVFSKNIKKISDTAKIGFLGTLYYSSEDIVYRAEIHDLHYQIQYKRHSIFKNILDEAKEFRRKILKECLLLSKGKDKPPRFVIRFNNSFSENNEKNFKKYLIKVPKKYISLWLDEYFEGPEFKKELEYEESNLEKNKN